MKAIRVHQFGTPEVMQLEEVADPQPGPEQVVVKAHAIGVNPVETYIRAGRYPVSPQLPYTPGTDAAGVIETVGPGVTHLSPGSRVYVGGALSGAYAERILCHQQQVYPLPTRVSFSQGAAVNIPYATAYRALFRRANALPAEHVLVHGAGGGVGIAAVQLARAAGMIVIGTASTERGRSLIREQGAHHVFDHHAPDHLARIPAAIGGQGVDVILEMLANVNLATDLKALAKGGRIVIIGSRGTIEIDPRDAMTRDAAIIGMTLSNAAAHELISIHAAIVAGLANGTLNPIIGREFPLAEATRAHQTIMEPGTYGKIILIP